MRENVEVRLERIGGPAMNAASNALARAADVFGPTPLLARARRLLASSTADLLSLWPVAVILLGVAASVAWTGLLGWFAYLALAYLISS